jgi:TPR repeat protein
MGIYMAQSKNTQHINIQDVKENPQDRSQQILSLLNVLGERLIASERERAYMSAAMEDLEAKADQSERIFLTLQDRQAKIEAEYKAQLKKLERANDFIDRIDEALALNESMTKRLDAMAQERSQLLRKVQLLEQTIVETKDAVKANALMAIANQKAANTANDDLKPWQNPQKLRLLATTAVILVGFIAGISTYALMPSRNIDTPPSISFNAGSNPAFINGNTPESASVNKDIWRASDQELNQKFEEDPDALAAALNAIEPTSTPPFDQISPVEEVPLVDKVVAVAPTDESTKNTAPEAAEKKDQAATASIEGNAVTQNAASTELAASAAAIAVPAAPQLLPREIELFLAQQQAQAIPLSRALNPDKNLPAQIKEIEKKAFAGDADAQHDLAAIYTAGHAGVKRNFGRAITLFRAAALQNIANARYNLGVLHHQGLGVDKDLNQAILWYKSAAFMSHPEAQYNLGIAYIEGVGTNYDPIQAASNFEKAAQAGIMEAAFNLGLIYENGLLGAVDASTALYWYSKAAEKGSPDAQAAQEQLMRRLGLSESELKSTINKISLERNDTAKTTPERHGASAVTNNTEKAVITAHNSKQESSKLASTPQNNAVAIATNNGAKLATPPKPQGNLNVQALRPEDKINIAEVAQYLPKLDDPGLIRLARTIEDMDAPAQSHKQAMIADVQKRLNQLGLYRGSYDGVMGKMTQQALHAYQRAHNLPVTEGITNELYVHITRPAAQSFNMDDYDLGANIR